MNKEFERCCTFLAEMMEKYGLEVLRDIAVELQFDPEIWRDDAEGKVMMQKEKDFGMRLMRRDFWSGLRKQHKDCRHSAKFVSSFQRKLDM